MEEIKAQLEKSTTIQKIAVILCMILIITIIIAAIIGIDCAIFWAISYMFGFEFDFIKAILCTPVWFALAIWISNHI